MGLNQLWSQITGTNKGGPLTAQQPLPYDYTGLYEVLYALYNNDADIVDDDTTRRLRTVVNRSVEFFASKMLPGKELGVTADKPAVKDAIEQVIKSSNFGNNKPAMLRGFALYGDSFIRVRGDDKKTYLEDISPFFMTDFEDDSRGFMVYARIDVPTLDAENMPILYTEYWDKASQTLRIWYTHLSSGTPIKNFPPPSETHKFSEYGIDFIPIVHTKFRDNGDARGLSCVYHALDKIYEGNRLATRLHDMLFRFGKPFFIASANDKDAAGRPLPPPKIATDATGTATAAETSKETIFGDVIGMPGVSQLDALVPDVRYADALAILNANMDELEKDLPELRWYSVAPDSNLSGKALRTMLGAAVDRANEARENFISSLSRAFEMALTIGMASGAISADLGSFDNGDFAHELTADDPWAESIAEKADTMSALTGAGVPAKAAMSLAGFTDDQVAEAFPDAGPGSAPNANAPQNPPQMTTGTIVRGGNGKSGVQVVRVN